MTTKCCSNICEATETELQVSAGSAGVHLFITTPTSIALEHFSIVLRWKLSFLDDKYF